MNVEIVLDIKAELGEGPSWDSKTNVLYWVDIPQGLVHIYDPEKSKNLTIPVGEPVSCVVPRKNGGVVVTLQHGFYSLDLKTGKTSPIYELKDDLPQNRFNDGKCDPKGRFWAGTMDKNEKNPSGGLYRLEKNRTIEKVVSDVTISNGLGWSPDNKTMYYIDTPTKKVSAFDYDLETGNVKNRRTVVDFSNQPGEPDGMAVDVEGMLWIAHWGGNRVSHWDPTTGKEIDYISLPASHVTSCCFAGKDLDELYITTAREGLDQKALEREPLSGDLFKVEPGVKGLPTYAFDG